MKLRKKKAESVIQRWKQDSGLAQRGSFLCKALLNIASGSEKKHISTKKMTEAPAVFSVM